MPDLLTDVDLKPKHRKWRVVFRDPPVDVTLVIDAVHTAQCDESRMPGFDFVQYLLKTARGVSSSEVVFAPIEPDVLAGTRPLEQDEYIDFTLSPDLVSRGERVTERLDECVLIRHSRALVPG